MTGEASSFRVTFISKLCEYSAGADFSLESNGEEDVVAVLGRLLTLLDLNPVKPVVLIIWLWITLHLRLQSPSAPMPIFV